MFAAAGTVLAADGCALAGAVSFAVGRLSFAEAGTVAALVDVAFAGAIAGTTVAGVTPFATGEVGCAARAFTVAAAVSAVVGPTANITESGSKGAKFVLSNFNDTFCVLFVGGVDAVARGSGVAFAPRAASGTAPVT